MGTQIAFHLGVFGIFQSGPKSSFSNSLFSGGYKAVKSTYLYRSERDRYITKFYITQTMHVLHRLLPPVAHTSHNYNLRPRAHDRSLPERLTHYQQTVILLSVCYFIKFTDCI